MQHHRKGTGVTGCMPWCQTLRYCYLIAMHVSLILGRRLRGNHPVKKANLQWSLLMNVDLLQGTEQALMLHSVSIIIPCIFDVAVVYCCLGGGVFTYHQIRELDGCRVGHMLVMAPSNPS